MKKIHVFQIILVLSFIIFLFFLFTPKNYTKNYKISKVKITETYNKENKNYYFTFTYNNITLDYLVNSSYKQQRTFVKNLKIIEDKEDFCLIPTGKKIEFYPLCYQNKEIIHYSLANDNLKSKMNKNLFSKEKKLATHKDIEIYNKDFTYLIWNYTGFDYINKNTTKEIKIFNKEYYNINLIYYTNDYLVIADYSDDYTYKKIHTIEFKKGKIKTYEIKYNIYLDSYFIGYVKNKAYIVDNKDKLMYEFNAKNGEIKKIESKILNRGTWEEVNIKKLIKQDKEFSYETNYEYTYKDNNIYLNYYEKKSKMLVSKNITSIIRITDKDIFYLKDDSLYHFNPIVGEEKLLASQEWNFNYNNIIYLN